MIKLKSIIFEGEVKIDNKVYDLFVDVYKTLYGAIRRKLELGTTDNNGTGFVMPVPYNGIAMVMKVGHIENENGCWDEGPRTLTIMLPIKTFTEKSTYQEGMSVLKHEFVHVIQSFPPTPKRGYDYGIDKKSLRRKSGYDFFGGKKYSDQHYRGIPRPTQAHDLRSTEYKPLLSGFKDRIEKVLAVFKSDTLKKAAFLFYVGAIDVSSPSVTQMRAANKELTNKIQYDITRDRLLSIKNKDKPRWTQFVKELYVLLFN